MKKILLPFVIIVLNFAIGFANTYTEHSVVEPKCDDIQILIDLGKITDISDIDLYNRIEVFFMSQMSDITSVDSAEEVTCTITVRGSVGVGKNSIEIEVTVTGPCNEVAAKAKLLLKQAKDIVSEVLR